MAIEFIGFGATHPDPSEMISTEELFDLLIEKGVDINEKDLAKIRDRVGMRYHWKTSKKSSELALMAAHEACERAATLDPDFRPEDIRLIVSGGSTLGRLYAATSALIQRELGIPKLACRVMDISNACCSWTQGVMTAYDIMRSGDMPNGNRVDYALVAVGEVPFSRMNVPNSLNFCLWDNNGGAAVMKNNHKPDSWDHGILGTCSGANGESADVAEGTLGTDYLPCWWEDDWPTPREVPNARLNDGSMLYRHVVENTPPLIKELVSRLGLTIDTRTTFAGHDANLRMYGEICEGVGIPPEGRLTLLGENNRSNGSSSSIPSKLEHFHRLGRFSKGDLTLIAGYAAGELIDGIAYRW